MSANIPSVGEVQMICALRFGGYRYEDISDQSLAELSEAVVVSLVFHEEMEDNFAAYFSLQRYLAKWGGEQLDRETPERIAFDLLFLHLYRQDTPARYKDENF